MSERLIEDVAVSTEKTTVIGPKRRGKGGRRTNARHHEQGNVLKCVITFSNGDNEIRYIGKGRGGRLGRPQKKKASVMPLNGTATTVAKAVRTHLQELKGKKRISSWRPANLK